MIFIPMLKTRLQELKVAKDMNHCFSDDIIPLFEIIRNKYKTRYKRDPETNLFVIQPKNGKRYRIKENPTEDDVITLQNINEIINGEKAFIDYFRFTIEKYGKRIDITKTDLAWNLSNDENLYLEHIKGISRYPNLIPVVSIKDGFDMKISKLKIFLNEIQCENSSIALRITENWLETYREIIIDTLRNTDYLLFDIGEQNPETKFMEFEELSELKSNAKIVVLNSPRKVEYNNGKYEVHEITELINNSARIEILDYDFEGYGDYCGLKDQLPLKGGSNGMGAALALIYDYEKNGFHSYMNPDTKQGFQGYNKLIPIILSEKNILDPPNDCPAIEKIDNLKKSGNWSTWHNICVTRYIHQVFMNI